MRNFKARTDLMELLYDMKLKMDNGQVEEAYELMKKRVEKIEKIKLMPYRKIVWSD